MDHVEYHFSAGKYNELKMIKHVSQEDFGGRMELKISKIGEVVTIILEGRIDANVAPDIEQKALSLISEGSCELVADLSNVLFISSAGLRALITALKEAKRKKGDLRLAGVKGMVMEVFDITGFSSIFKIYENAEESIKSFID